MWDTYHYYVFRTLWYSFISFFIRLLLFIICLHVLGFIIYLHVLGYYYLLVDDLRINRCMPSFLLNLSRSFCVKLESMLDVFPTDCCIITVFATPLTSSTMTKSKLRQIMRRPTKCGDWMPWSRWRWWTSFRGTLGHASSVPTKRVTRGWSPWSGSGSSPRYTTSWTIVNVSGD